MSKYLKVIAVFLAVVGLLDSVYLTLKHYTAEPVPCSLIEGCEQVLTSPYAEVFGLPLAAYGAAAYFIAFSLAVLAIYGNDFAWKLFGFQSVLMALFSLWLIYVQAALIGAFCQFCLLSALSSISLFTVFVISIFATGRQRRALQ